MNAAIDIFKYQVQKINIQNFKVMLDRDITLFEWFGDRMPSKSTIQSAVKLLNINTEEMTFNLVLNLFAQHNPAAYNLILNHQNGTKWLQKTLDQLKEWYTPK